MSWAGPHEGVYGVPAFNEICPDYLCPWLDWAMDVVLDGGWVSQGK